MHLHLFLIIPLLCHSHLLLLLWVPILHPLLQSLIIMNASAQSPLPSPSLPLPTADNDSFWQNSNLLNTSAQSPLPSPSLPLLTADNDSFDKIPHCHSVTWTQEVWQTNFLISNHNVYSTPYSINYLLHLFLTVKSFLVNTHFIMKTEDLVKVEFSLLLVTLCPVYWFHHLRSWKL